jgi:hypothetical protein
MTTQKEQRVLKAIEKSGLDATLSDPITFTRNCTAYAKAVKEGRLCVAVESVSRSGMTRYVKFAACEKLKGVSGTAYRYRDFTYFLHQLLGWPMKNGCLVVGGCGMDMVFYTNYTAIHEIRALGAITPGACEDLAQRAPAII